MSRMDTPLRNLFATAKQYDEFVSMIKLRVPNAVIAEKFNLHRNTITKYKKRLMKEQHATK